MEKKHIVEKYIEGFRSGNQEMVLECLADNVVWRLHGCNTFTGKLAFASNIDNEEFCKIPVLEIREIIQEGDRIAVLGHGAVDEKSGERRTFNFCEIFLFKGELVSEVDTFHIWNL